MNTTTSFTVSAEGTDKQKEEFNHRQAVQDDRYRDFRVEQIDDVSTRNDIRLMVRHRDHEMDIKRNRDIDAIEQEIETKLMKSTPPDFELTPVTPGGRTMSKLEQKHAKELSIRHDTYLLMQPEFEQENKELLESINQEIDKTIDVTLAVQQEEGQEHAEVIGYDEALHL